MFSFDISYKKTYSFHINRKFYISNFNRDRLSMLEIIDDCHDVLPLDDSNDDLKLEPNFCSKYSKNPVIGPPHLYITRSITNPFTWHLFMKLEDENKNLKDENENIRNENENLKDENKNLQTTIQHLQQTVDTFSEVSLPDPTYPKKKNLFNCFVCKKNFDTFKALNKHCMSNQHICCRTCSKKQKKPVLFESYNSLSNHLKTSHLPFE